MKFFFITIFFKRASFSQTIHWKILMCIYNYSVARFFWGGIGNPKRFWSLITVGFPFALVFKTCNYPQLKIKLFQVGRYASWTVRFGTNNHTRILTTKFFYTTDLQSCFCTYTYVIHVPRYYFLYLRLGTHMNNWEEIFSLFYFYFLTSVQLFKNINDN